jgi:hypothetical protein
MHPLRDPGADAVAAEVDRRLSRNPGTADRREDLAEILLFEVREDERPGQVSS